MNNKLEGFYGIVLYDIEMDGCLNGVYTNMSDECHGVIYNEIARKKKCDKKEIAGIYDSQFFDLDNDRYFCKLEITRRRGTEINIYDFRWHDIMDEENQTVNREYVGVGYQMNERQISVTYWPTT